MSGIADEFEPAVQNLARRIANIDDVTSIDQMIAPLMSAAISLKRIADAMEKLDFDRPLNAYGETIGNCIQGQLDRGGHGFPGA